MKSQRFQIVLKRGRLHKFLTRTQPWKSSKKILFGAIGLLSGLCKGLDDMKNAPNNTLIEAVEDHINLIEQVVLLLGQALNSFLYCHRVIILKSLMKAPKKVKVS